MSKMTLMAMLFFPGHGQVMIDGVVGTFVGLDRAYSNGNIFDVRISVTEVERLSYNTDEQKVTTEIKTIRVVTSD